MRTYWPVSWTEPLAGAVALALLLGSSAQAAQPVLQRGYDAGVSGATLTEATLNTSDVAPNTFGLVFKLPVDDRIFAQPLYVPNVVIPSHGTHNVVYVATLSDTLYAFDADAGGAPLWSTNLASLFHTTPVVWVNFARPPSAPPGNLGILSTPVIDPSTNVMYVIACTLENNTLAYRLHAIDITTGAEPYGPGVLITGTIGGSTFDAPYQTQRLSLVLSGSQVVIGFGAMEQEYAGNYVGWMMAYNKTTLQQSGVFATVTTGNRGGGAWQSGRPPVVDSAGDVYVFTGNAYGGGYDGVNDFSESVLKLDPSQGLKLLDWFTPGNWSYLDAHDLDLSASGPLLIPGTSLLAGGGKTGDLYVLDTANLGKFNPNDSQVVQKENILQAQNSDAAGGLRGGPVYWQRSTANGGPILYSWGIDDWVRAYPFNGTTFAANPSAQGTGNSIFPGGILALSANGEQHGSGVLWATTRGTGQGELHAFDAENVSNELWNSAMNATRDSYGIFVVFVPPLVANGKVYVATGSNQLAVYGLFSTYTLSPTSLAFGSETAGSTSTPLLVTVTSTGSVALPIKSITLSDADSSQFSQTNTCGVSVAVAATCVIRVVFKPTTTGSKAATLNVDAGGAPTAVALSGVVPLSVSIKASAATLTAGQSVTLSWVATPGASCSASGGSATDGWSGSIAASGTKAVTESTAATYVYGLSCIGGSQTEQAQASVVVTSPAVTATLTASPTTINAGQATTLTWSSSNASSCSATGGGASDSWPGTKAANGSATLTEANASATSLTLSFILTCTSSASGKSAQATAKVTENPPAAAKSGGGGSFDSLALIFLVSAVGARWLRQRSASPPQLLVIHSGSGPNRRCPINRAGAPATYRRTLAAKGRGSSGTRATC